MARESAFQRLIRHFHEHPQGRLHEFLFWAGLGVGLGALALWGHLAGWMDLAYVLMLAIVALCLFLWAFLPQRKTRPRGPPPPPGKRGAIVAAKKNAGTKLRKKPPPKVG